MKFAFIVILTFISVMSTVTVQNVEAKRLLSEETLQNVLHDEVNALRMAKPQGFHCKEGCHVSCIPIQLVIRCVCLC
ncbi:hypothetical protein EUTSA_v10023074mg [Eutrema salsugineum]|uniref:Uncharacterized protein n=1 Tax=Eutrema salsugineum TaxID=72664 RepID=V4NVX2_EUTSA|nr:hypothetical protein EUTSA_v10023074mg [Eutrema salsugineum]